MASHEGLDIIGSDDDFVIEGEDLLIAQLMKEGLESDEESAEKQERKKGTADFSEMLAMTKSAEALQVEKREKHENETVTRFMDDLVFDEEEEPVASAVTVTEMRPSDMEEDDEEEEEDDGSLSGIDEENYIPYEKVSLPSKRRIRLEFLQRELGIDEANNKYNWPEQSLDPKVPVKLPVVAQFMVKCKRQTHQEAEDVPVYVILLGTDDVSGAKGNHYSCFSDGSRFMSHFANVGDDDVFYPWSTLSATAKELYGNNSNGWQNFVIADDSSHYHEHRLGDIRTSKGGPGFENTFSQDLLDEWGSYGNTRLNKQASYNLRKFDATLKGEPIAKPVKKKAKPSKKAQVDGKGGKGLRSTTVAGKGPRSSAAGKRPRPSASDKGDHATPPKKKMHARVMIAGKAGKAPAKAPVAGKVPTDVRIILSPSAALQGIKRPMDPRAARKSHLSFNRALPDKDKEEEDDDEEEEEQELEESSSFEEEEESDNGLEEEELSSAMDIE